MRKYGNSNIKFTGLKNLSRQRVALNRKRDEAGCFDKSKLNPVLPMYKYHLPSESSAPIFKIEKVRRTAPHVSSEGLVELQQPLVTGQGSFKEEDQSQATFA